MKAIRAVKLKLVTNDSRFEMVSAAYLRAANWLSPIIFERGRPENPNKLSREFYGTVREKFNLPSQVTQSLFRQITATYHAAKSNGRWRLAVFKKPVLPLVWKRDYNLTIKYGLTIWGKPVEWRGPILPASAWRDSKLKKVKGVWYLILTVEIDIPEPKMTGSVVGVDSGIKNVFVAVGQSSNKTRYIKGGRLNHCRRCIRRTKSQVSSVGTPSAKRLLKRLSGREKAVTRQLLHVASKQLATWADSVNARVLVMEDLAGIRKGSKKGKKFRASVHRWPYAQAQFYVGYKTAAKGIAFELVDPRYTSQACPRCGHTERGNRHSLSFLCMACGFADHADRVGATNVALRYVSLRQAEEERAAVNRLIVASSTHVASSVTSPRL